MDQAYSPSPVIHCAFGRRRLLELGNRNQVYLLPPTRFYPAGKLCISNNVQSATAKRAMAGANLPI